MHERPLHVFYNASALPERPAGAGVYTLELGKALAARDDVELSVAAPRDVGFGHRKNSPPNLRGRTAWEFAALGDVLRRSAADVYHGPHFFVPQTAIPTVATIHDLTFFRLPRRYTFAHRQYYRYLAWTARRAGRLIAPSSAVASDILRYLHVDPARIRVIAEAPRAGLAPATAEAVSVYRSRAGLPDRYLLCLGTAEPGKRAIDALRALPAIVERAPDVVLALAGNPGRLSRALQREVSSLGVERNVAFLGYVPDEDLPALLTGAAALVFPSLYEGFGLPPLEAMACGTPVIASDAPAMSEVLRGAANSVPLGSPAAIARIALKLLADEAYRSECAAVGMEHARRFSWERAAAETVEVYREVAS